MATNNEFIQAYPNNKSIQAAFKAYKAANRALKAHLNMLEKRSSHSVGASDTDNLEGLVLNVQIAHREYVSTILEAQNPGENFNAFRSIPGKP